jgi:hypothetical protein
MSKIGRDEISESPRVVEHLVMRLVADDGGLLSPTHALACVPQLAPQALHSLAILFL